MIDLKITKADRKRRDKKHMEPCSIDGSDEYPYGLRLHLDTETLKKLGIGLPDVGQKFVVTAVAQVRSASENKRSGGTTDRNCDLQITKASIKPARGNAVGAVKAALKEM